MHQDLSDEIEQTILGDVKIRMTRAEAMLYRMLHLGRRIQLAMRGEECVGFLLYAEAFSNVIAIRALYTVPGLEGQQIGRKLVDSLGLPLAKVLFQTRTKHPPKRCLEITEGRRQLIEEKEDFTTWMMDWEVSNG